LQAERAARDLATLNPDLIVSSDLERARTTAEALAQIVALPVQTDESLRETYAGDWQGLTRQEILDRDGDDFYRWINGEDVKPGGGESRGEVAHRVARAVRQHAAALPENGTLVVATHGGAARAGIGELLGLPIEFWASLGGLVNCAWSVLEEQRDGRWTQHYREIQADQPLLWQREAADDAQAEALCNEVQRSLDLAQGPLLRGLHLRQAGKADRLLLVVHLVNVIIYVQVFVNLIYYWSNQYRWFYWLRFQRLQAGTISTVRV
jgi:probable phosphoglycerate mutase